VAGAAAALVLAAAPAGVASAAPGGGRPHGDARAATAGPMRPLPDPLYGVTVDDVGNLGAIVAGAKLLPSMPTTRIYFDVKEPARSYAAAVDALQPVSYLMGELLDSSDSRRIGTRAYDRRVRSYVAAFGNQVDLWEIGNEVNGDWTGRYPAVEAKLTRAYDDVTAAGRRSALTLYDDVGCGDSRRELDPLAFSRAYVPPAVRDGLSYVFLSYYEDECHGIRPGAASWTAYFAQLHALYPDAELGFGEIGMVAPATTTTQAEAQALMTYYYSLPVDLPYYVGGYFWWYYDEDCLPAGTTPLWSTLQGALGAEAAALAH